MWESERDHDLPQTTIRRWTIRRKAALLEALQSGTLSLEEASRGYALSLEELRTWERDFQRHGVYGLRATRFQIYREQGSGIRPKKAGRPMNQRQHPGMGAVERARLQQLEEENTRLMRLVESLGSNKMQKDLRNSSRTRARDRHDR